VQRRPSGHPGSGGRKRVTCWDSGGCVSATFNQHASSIGTERDGLEGNQGATVDDVAEAAVVGGNVSATCLGGGIFST